MEVRPLLPKLVDEELEVSRRGALADRLEMREDSRAGKRLDGVGVCSEDL